MNLSFASVGPHAVDVRELGLLESFEGAYDAAVFVALDKHDVGAGTVASRVNGTDGEAGEAPKELAAGVVEVSGGHEDP